jgi:hypothetical protein
MGKLIAAIPLLFLLVTRWLIIALYSIIVIRVAQPFWVDVPWLGHVLGGENIVRYPIIRRNIR